MRLTSLWLTDFRSYPTAELELAPDGLTVVVGSNGEGKTNLLEGIAYLATLESFRGAPPEAMIRVGADRAVVRAEAERDDRRLLLEAELVAGGRSRVQVNRQPLRRNRDLLGALRVSVFSPDDLVLVKGGPGERRRFLDTTLVSLHPKHDALRADVDRILRQRGTLLKQAGGRLSDEVAFTLDVWDQRLADAGTELAAARTELTERLEPEAGKAYDRLAGTGGHVTMTYRPSWEGPLLDALGAARADDVRRGVSTVGPHRDDLGLSLGGLPARTHASQGEQRSLALAMRLGAHTVVTEAVGAAPVLLLDDVFSELDDERSAALVESLPIGQAVLTTATAPPAGIVASRTVRVASGRVVA